MSGIEHTPRPPGDGGPDGGVGSPQPPRPVRLVASTFVLAVLLGAGLLLDGGLDLRATLMPAPTPTPTPVPATAASSPALAPTSTATATPAGTPTPAPTATSAATPAPTATPKATPAPTAAPVVTPAPIATPAPTAAPSGDYLLMSRATLLARPTSGSAWTALKSVADGSLGTADLCNQDNKHAVRTLGVALVYARTGDDAYRTKARNAIMTAIGTTRVGCNNAILSLGRQLGAYVLAADFIGLSGTDDQTFRTWLSGIRTKDLGGHGRWRTLRGTHEDSPNNWGAFAGASRIAASLYLGDKVDVARAARVFRGFIGNRASWSAWGDIDDTTLSWVCDPARFTPLNARCSRNGIDLDGAIGEDVSRGGDLRWPPGRDGLLYQMESLQGLVLQAELLARAGNAAWEWESSALRRAAGFVTRADGWNMSGPGRHVPWLLNARYGLNLPTEPADVGRVFGYTDWLYGS